MRPSRFCWAGAVLMIAAGPAHAESFVSAVGNYYKERSTRVAAPSINARLDLPDQWRVQGGFLVDQITSASGAFTATDEPFTEYRVEASAAVDKQFGWLRPGLNAKFSNESDYTSVLVGGSLAALLNQDLTTLSLAFQYQADSVGRRTTDRSDGARQQGADQFRDELDTYYFNVDATHVLRPNLLGGLTMKVELLRGFTENVYRQEQHPRVRNDYTLGGFLRFWYEPWDIGVILEECLHYSSWEHWGMATELSLWKTVTRWFEIVPSVRWYEQPVGTFFVDGVEVQDPNSPGSTINYNTRDPSLFPHRVVQVGAQLVFIVEDLGGLRIQPSYYFRHQTTMFGDAHIAQLGFYFPL